MVSSAIAQEGSKVSECQCRNAVRAQINYVAYDLSDCQPTRQDYEHTLEVIRACSEAINEDPMNGTAYRDRALAFAFLGRDLESRQDSLQAAYLGLDRRQVREEVKLVRKIAIDGQNWEDARSVTSDMSRGPGLASVINSLFGLRRII